MHRADPLGMRAFDRPTVLRRLFRRPGSSFLEPGSPERRILAMLMADDRQESEAASAPRSGERWPVPEGRLLFERASALARGQVSLPGFWGEDAVVDRLRLRALSGSGAPARVPWEGFLAWAGAALPSGTEPLPEEALPAACAAVAAARGYRKAVETVLARLPGAPLGARAARALRITAMRLAIEGGFARQTLRWLVPGLHDPPPEGGDAGDLWRPGLLALRACREHDNEAGVVHLTAALAAGHFRWGAGRGGRPPWPLEWGGPDGSEVAARIASLVGGRADLLRLVLLDERLAVAAVWGLLGRTPSALAQLAGGSAEVAALGPLFQAAREALRQGLLRRTRPGLPAERPFSRDADRLRALVESTPDPSVALATPHWMLERGRGALTNRLIRQGRRDDARHLRTVLDRADLRESLSPFWLLQGPADAASVLALARWLRDRVPVPGEREWLAFMEWECRRMVGVDE